MPPFEHGFTLSDLIGLISTIVGCTWYIGRLLLKTRDGIRDTLHELQRAVEDITEKMGTVQGDLDRTTGRMEEARDWLIEAGLRPERRVRDTGPPAERRRDHLTIRKQGL